MENYRWNVASVLKNTFNRNMARNNLESPIFIEPFGLVRSPTDVNTIPNYNAKYDCREFAFLTLLGGKLPYGFALSDISWIDLLTSKGYRNVAEPQAGDLIMYGYPYGENQFSDFHMGVILDPQKALVISKFGQLIPYVHHASFILDLYEDHFLLFRKPVAQRELEELQSMLGRIDYLHS